MGVHISFVRSVQYFLLPHILKLRVNSSTNLDSWQLNQLRAMKVGGNASATEFFTRHGGASLLSDTDPKKKYSSRTAELYKEELARRVKEDSIKYVSLNPARSKCLSQLLDSRPGPLLMEVTCHNQLIPHRRRKKTSFLLGTNLPRLNPRLLPLQPQPRPQSVDLFPEW